MFVYCRPRHLGGCFCAPACSTGLFAVTSILEVGLLFCLFGELRVETRSSLRILGHGLGGQGEAWLRS